MRTLTFDFTTKDKKNNEFVAYLVEVGPWDNLDDRLELLQDKLNAAFDVAVEGHLASKYKEAQGQRIRIQVDSQDSPPPDILNFVRRFEEYVQSDPEHNSAIEESPFIESIRFVNGQDMGRNFK